MFKGNSDFVFSKIRPTGRLADKTSQTRSTISISCILIKAKHCYCFQWSHFPSMHRSYALECVHAEDKFFELIYITWYVRLYFCQFNYLFKKDKLRNWRLDRSLHVYLNLTRCTMQNTNVYTCICTSSCHYV